MSSTATLPRHDWTRAEIEALFDLPCSELMFQAAATHRRWFDPAEVQLSQLLSVKTGGCAENCGYCSQSAHFDTGLKAEKLMAASDVIAAAMQAKAGGAQRFCMGAAWRDLKDRDLPKVAAMISGVKALPGDLRHPRHAERRPGESPEGRRARLLQPQPRPRPTTTRRS